jgi:large subunit ribosomal protein L4
MKTNVIDINGKPAGNIELSESVFGLDSRPDILHRVVLWQLAKRRAGTHAVKERGDVSGSTKKIVRQKGSGGARHGSKRGAQFRGGGIIFGPVVRDHGYDLPKKVRKLGLKVALSEKLRAGSLMVIKSLELGDCKTKTAKDHLKNLNLDVNKTLFIDNEAVNENFFKATLNLHNVDVLPQIGANVYDIMRKDMVILTVDAIKTLEERLK